MLSQQNREAIIGSLEQIPPNTIYGMGVKLFLAEEKTKTDEQVIEVVKEIKQALNCGPENMKEVLGNTYNFFKHINLDIIITTKIKPVTFITGKPGSGKTVLARQMVYGRKSTWLNGLDINKSHFLDQIPHTTEVIVIEEANKINMEKLKVLITSSKLSLRDGKQQVETERPEIIALSQDENFNLITTRSYVKHISL